MKENKSYIVHDEQLNFPNKDDKTPKSKKEKFKKISKFILNRWFVEAFSGMAQGLFVTLIAGTIIKQIGLLIGNNTFGKMLVMMGSIASLLMGAGIGAGIATHLKCPKLIIFSTMIAGMVGAYSSKFISGTILLGPSQILLIGPGNPIGAYVASLMACEFSRFIYGKTKLDILIIPLSVMIISLAAIYAAYPAIKFIQYIQILIEKSTNAVPFVAGVIISVVMGILLTFPTSSAAIWIAIASGVNTDAMLLAGGAAVVGCASHMIGYAVISYKTNRFSGFIAQGLGTSMLQIPNIMKKPRILLPPIIASAILGPLSTMVFKLRCNAIGGGMGTCGFVGVFGVVDASRGVISNLKLSFGIILLMFILPAIISYLVFIIMRKLNLVKDEDLVLSLGSKV